MNALYAVAQMLVDFMSQSPPLLASLVAIAIASVPVVAVHELGHAYAARGLLNVDVAVAVGSTGRLADVQLGQVRMQLNALGGLGGPAGSASFEAGHATARDVLLIALAGPAASLAALVPTIALYSAAQPGSTVHGLLWAATGLGVFGVLNLIPFSYSDTRNGPVLRSDGRLALDALSVMRAVCAV